MSSNGWQHQQSNNHSQQQQHPLPYDHNRPQPRTNVHLPQSLDQQSLQQQVWGQQQQPQTQHQQYGIPPQGGIGQTAALPSALPAAVPAATNSLQAMLQQLQQQQQQLLPKPAAASFPQTQTQPPAQLPYAQASAPAATTPFAQLASLLPQTVNPAVPGAFNLASLTPLQQAQLLQLQQLQQQQQQQQQQQLARLLAALIPGGVPGAGVPSPQIPLGNVALPGAGTLPTPTMPIGAPQEGATGAARPMLPTSSAARDDRGRGNDSYMNRRRDRDRSDSRDRYRDRSRSPNRRDNNRRRSGRGNRSDSDSDDSYYASRRRDSRRDSRDRDSRRRSPTDTSRRGGGDPAPPGLVPDGGLHTRHLWIGDMPLETTEREVQEAFGHYGRIVEIKMLPLRKGRASGFLAFATKAAASKAMKADNLIHGSRVSVRINSRFADLPDPDEPENFTGVQAVPITIPRGYLQVSGLPAGVSTESLLTEFQRFGRVLDIRRDHNAPTAIVEFERAPDANNARNLARTFELWGIGARVAVTTASGEVIKPAHIVERSVPREILYPPQAVPYQARAPIRRGHTETCSLYLPLVPSAVTEAELQTLCEPFGELENVRLIPGKLDPRTSMAFINYRELEAAKRAYNGLSGRHLFGQRDALKIEYAQSAPLARRTVEHAGPPKFTNRSLVLNGGGNGPPVPVKPEPTSLAVIFKDFSHRLSGREIYDNLSDLLRQKLALGGPVNGPAREITLFHMSSLEDCYAAVTGLPKWSAEQVAKDFKGFEFFGSPLDCSIVTYQEAVNPPSLPNALKAEEMDMDAGTLRAIVPNVSYRASTNAAEWERQPYGAILVEGSLQDINTLLTGTPRVVAQSLDGPTRAFLVFETKDAAQAVMASNSSSLQISHATATPNIVRIRTTDPIPREELTRVFSRYGPVTKQLHIRDAPRPEAFIVYDTPEQAARAVSGMNGELIGGFDEELKVVMWFPPVDGADLEGSDDVRAKIKNEGDQRQESESDEDDEDEMEIMEEFVVEARPVPATPQKPKPTTIGQRDSDLVQVRVKSVEQALQQSGAAAEQDQASMDMDTAMDIDTTAEPTPVTTGQNSPARVEHSPAPDMDISSPDEPSPMLPPSTLAYIALKSKHAAVNVTYLSGNQQALTSALPLAPTPLKMVQRFKVTTASLSELSAKMPPADRRWAVALVEVAPNLDTKNFQFISQYFRDRAAAGMLVDPSGASVSLIPICPEATEFMTKFAPAALEKEKKAHVMVLVIIGA
ncbi:hypothetical protein HKX48_004154 [Thoreauomyces humboldtii]|nr:hypothetical protein HKX48_004154 [Thoreauomyces humboldtii]